LDQEASVASLAKEGRRQKTVERAQLDLAQRRCGHGASEGGDQTRKTERQENFFLKKKKKKKKLGQDKAQKHERSVLAQEKGENRCLRGCGRAHVGAALQNHGGKTRKGIQCESSLICFSGVVVLSNVFHVVVGRQAVSEREHGEWSNCSGSLFHDDARFVRHAGWSWFFLWCLEKKSFV
jgi:hypothetical protein